ncbi:MAG: DUF262 domain-containing protein [Paludibacteraceae bacterium]|nr:DUF262 domain-containing protein [Paludibacteraceae bacterium]
MSENATISLKQFLDKNKTFVIPSYQRGYVWGKSRGSEKNSVEYILESIQNCLDNNTELFMQGITVTEKDDKIILIDGQQRTTFFYLLLTCLEYRGDFNLYYPIRTESDEFLKGLKGKKEHELKEICADDPKEKYQDKYYFKKTIRLILDKANDWNIDKILDSVKFLYITISEDKATIVFSMMNGSKADMKTEEIIKAEMLRLVSPEKNADGKSVKEIEAEHWEQNLLRSKYAREWDKWLYWWNRDDVAEFYHTGRSIMGLLVKNYLISKGGKIDKEGKYFEVFRDKLLRGDINEKLAKNVFYDLRHLQKKFEDVFNSISDDKKLHNKIGAILTLLNNDDKEHFVQWYFTSNEEKNIDEYYKLVFLGVSHKVIVENKSEDIENAKVEMLSALKSDNLYNEDKNHAFLQLLRRNIEEDTRLERPFCFSIWNQKSLEHIFPKSKVYHKDDETGKNMVGVYGENKDDVELNEIEKGMLDRALFCNNGSEHCIGNLVLLYKNENSKFGAKTVEEKKNIYFTPDQKDATKKFQSRHLLHTISVFANNNWSLEENPEGIPYVVSTIQKNKEKVINEIKEYYGIQ